jgi:hypothetical protein
MSLAFNDTSTYRGLVQMYEREISAQRATVSGNTNLLKEFTADANLAIDDYLTLAIQASGSWKIDDTNHTDYPEITTNIVANQREYSLLTDENGNAILDIYKVYAKDSASSAFRLLTPYDSDAETEASTFSDGMGATGSPTKYDKLANIIRLDKLPSANVTDGLKVSINREASYFVYTDTTKKAGFAGLHHKFFYLRPALDYARRNSLNSYPRIEAEVMKLEQDIKEYYGFRAKDERPNKLTAFKQDNR